jgi:inner membrane protein
MDSITQGLLGAVTAQLGFRRHIGRDATLVAVGVALLPDLDILIAPILAMTGSEDPNFSMMTSHRGITHSLLLYPFTAVPIAILWWWFRRSLWLPPEKTEEPRADSQTETNANPSFWWFYGCVLVALMTHPLLDLFTSYGTQLFLPITHHRYALDAVPIVDIIYTPILILTLLISYMVRKRKTHSEKTLLIIGWSGFLLSTAYLFAGLGLHHLAEEKLVRQYRTAAVAEPLSVRAYPQLGTIFVWRGTIQDKNRWSVAKLNFLYPDETLKWSHAPADENRWIRQAMNLPEIKLFEWFTLDQVRPVYLREDGFHVAQFFDMRYGLSPASTESFWSVRVVFDSAGSLVNVAWLHHERNLSFRKLIAQSWNEIVTP